MVPLSLRFILFVAGFVCAASTPKVIPSDTSIRWNTRAERVVVEAYGHDSIRVRVSRFEPVSDLAPGAVLNVPEVSTKTKTARSVVIREDQNGGNVTNGLIRAVITPVGDCCSGGGAAGISALSIAFVRTDTDALLLEEEYPLHGLPARTLKPLGRSTRLSSASVKFKGKDNERFYGLGHHLNGKLEVSGLVVDMDQFNTEISIPYLQSSLNYGILWNVPARGRVEVASGAGTHTRFHATATKQVDYVVFAGKTPFDVQSRYAESVGHPAAFPYYATGYWQSKDRYASQMEVMNITAEFARRDIPLSVIVIDDDPAFSPNVGDWKLNSKDWPDPKAMYASLDKMNVKALVSAWPSIEPSSSNWGPMYESGMLACPETGTCNVAAQVDATATIYDAFNPEAREYFFQQLQQNHFDNGATMIWLDSCEGSGSVGEDNPYPRTDAMFLEGSVDEVGLLYPYNHQRAVFEGMKRMNATAQPMTLSRSAFAGSSRWGAAVWSGDTISSWEYLQKQVPASISLSISGISAVTFDIGGFMGGINDIDNPEYQELVVRWFQLGTFMPITRLHGSRGCSKGTRGYATCPNEPWSFGAEAEKILVGMIHTREKLRPYVADTMLQAEQTGRPPVRPLFFDFEDDPETYLIDDQFIFGDQLLVAPILSYKQRQRRVYLPKGANWASYFSSGNVYKGGQWITASAQLDTIPVFTKA